MIGLHGVRVKLDEFDLSLGLSVARGQRLAVIGASGAGKSSLLNVVAGFLAPDAGTVRIDGVDVTGSSVAARPVSLLFQDGNLFPHLSVADNVALGLRPDLRIGAEDRDAVEAALAQVGLAGFGRRRPAELSGGQQARVALARMLLRDKPVALMDEPFAALDPGLRAEMADLVAELCAARGTTLILVAHELRGLDRLATDICLMAGGRVVLTGGVAALRADPPEALHPWL